MLDRTQITFVLDNWATMTTRQIRSNLNCSNTQIHQVATKFELKSIDHPQIKKKYHELIKDSYFYDSLVDLMLLEYRPRDIRSKLIKIGYDVPLPTLLRFIDTKIHFSTRTSWYRTLKANKYRTIPPRKYSVINTGKDSYIHYAIKQV